MPRHANEQAEQVRQMETVKVDPAPILPPVPKVRGDSPSSFFEVEVICHDIVESSRKGATPTTILPQLVKGAQMVILGEGEQRKEGDVP